MGCRSVFSTTKMSSREPPKAYSEEASEELNFGFAKIKTVYRYTIFTMFFFLSCNLPLE